MNERLDQKPLRPWSPANYCIEVEGDFSENRHGLFFGMVISTRKRGDDSVITTLTGRVSDQEELAEMLMRLANNYMPILKVEYLK